MLEINLIRWRSLERRRHFSQLMICVISSVLMAVCVVGGLYKYLDADIKKQTLILADNRALLDNIQLVATDQRVSISELQAYQNQYYKIKKIILRYSQIHHLFETLDSILPEAVALTAMQLRGDTLELKGMSYSNHALSQFLQQLSQLTEFQQPQLRLSLPKENETSHQGRSQLQESKYFELHVSYVGDSAQVADE